MKKYLQGLMIFVLMAGFMIQGRSQSATYETTTIKDLRSNNESSYSCEFTVYSGDHIEWIQGSDVKSFTITDTQGELPEEGTGQVTYSVTKEGQNGEIVIVRNESGLELTLDLRGSGEWDQGAWYLFTLTTP